MTRPTKRLTNMEIDEISLVDKGANQHAMITIAKRAPEEELMPELYNEDGELLDENDLDHGDIVFDDEGNAYEYILNQEQVEEKEPEPVGKRRTVEVNKSAFAKSAKPEQKSFAEQVMEELSKAYSDTDRDAVISKALGRVEELEGKYEAASEIAKSERDLRLTREYISKAAEYNLPVDPAELGPVLYRMAENMDFKDCAVIAKCLEGAGAMIFEEKGYIGGGDNVDILSQVEAVAKSNSPADVAAVFDSTPQAYDEYLAQRRY